jgi:hypothetical protein
MKKYFLLILLISILSINACTQPVSVASTSTPTTATILLTDTPIPLATSTTETTLQSDLEQFTNDAFGLSFLYPSTWYGPEEYISEQTIRVEIGTDIVYPYGTDRAEQVSQFNNSYSIVIQYTKNNQNTLWMDTYELLGTLNDGESNSGTRSMITRVRQVNLGNFSGYEYISTLSETAQTERFYSREILLVDEQSNLLTLFGTPNNVEVAEGSDWRMVFQQIDEENLPTFHEILDSMDIQ